MEYKDYYKVLGVEKNATPEEIKKRYRILARKYHPDVSKEKDAEAKFKEVREAYDVLKNPEKRKAYDRLGSHYHAGQGFTPPPGWQYTHNGGNGEEEMFGAGGFSDFFESLFGQQARRQSKGAHFSQRGRDIHSKVVISLPEAFKGVERILQLQEPGINPQTKQVQTAIRTIKVKIPPGVTSGQQIRLAGQGNKGIGNAPNGDLYLEIQLADHPFYSVKSKDIYLSLPVTPWEAALGAKVEVPTLAGKIELTIPPHSQAGQKLRLKGRGLPGNLPGDQYLTLVIYIPEPKNEQQRQLYQQMADAMPYNPRHELLRG